MDASSASQAGGSHHRVAPEIGDPQYRLAPDSFVCVAPEGAIFLDVRANAYVGIDSQQADALALVVEGWPVAPRVYGPEEAVSVQAPRDPVSPSAVTQFAELLCTRGVLVRSDTRGRSAEAICLPPAREQLIHWDEMSRSGMRSSHVARFGLSLASTCARLSLLPLRTVIARTQRVRQRHTTAAAGFDSAAAKELVGIYYHLRLWTFARRDRCLFDSLTLLEFLGKHGLYPQLVFGVKFRPFAAHTWLQHDEYVINGTPRVVRRYKPILVV